MKPNEMKHSEMKQSEMKHSEAIRYLADAGRGELDPEIERAVETHRQTCDACRDWLATRDLLARELADESRGSHPESDLLARWAGRAESLPAAERRTVEKHLEQCEVCRRDLDWIGNALDAAAIRTDPARPNDAPDAIDAPAVSTQGPTAPPPRLRRPALRHRIAALLAILAGSALLLATLSLDPFAVEPEPRADLAELGDADVEAPRIITGDHLVVSGVTVEKGADVTFRSGSVIAFGDGFRVDSGARLQVDASSAPNP